MLLRQMIHMVERLVSPSKMFSSFALTTFVVMVVLQPA